MAKFIEVRVPSEGELWQIRDDRRYYYAVVKGEMQRVNVDDLTSFHCRTGEFMEAVERVGICSNQHNSTYKTVNVRDDGDWSFVHEDWKDWVCLQVANFVEHNQGHLAKIIEAADKLRESE